MEVVVNVERITYIASTGDWRLVVSGGSFEILPQVGAWQYASGINLDNLAALIVAAKADAVSRGINWSGN
jgi:hypothetical protein